MLFPLKSTEKKYKAWEKILLRQEMRLTSLHAIIFSMHYFRFAYLCPTATLPASKIFGELF